MKRRHFIKTSGIFGLGLAVFPMVSFSEPAEKYSPEILMGKGNPKLFGNGYQLVEEAAAAFEKMKSEAAKSGIKIHIVSAYRNYTRQNQIWERKYKQFVSEGLTPVQSIEKIIEYSTIPGTSRHHWGTDMDIIDTAVPQPKSVLEPGHFHGNGVFCNLKEWLNENAENFGFHEVYTDNPNRKGFKYEPWHFSYAPVSVPMLKAYRKLDVKKTIQEEKLMGSEHFSNEFVERYISENVLDINPKLL